jgi:putative heme degradation protein
VHSIDLRIFLILCLRHSAVFFVTEMVDVKEQHVCIKFCCKLGKSVPKTHLMLKQAFGDYTLG